LRAAIAANPLMLTNSDWPVCDDWPELAGDEAHVWAVPLVMRLAAADQLTHALNLEEQERANDFRLDDARRRFVIARGALRHLLGKYLGLQPGEVTLAQGENEKPILAEVHAASGLQFNVSHSSDLALIAFASECEVGVDVERVRTVGHFEQISRRFFHPAETQAILGTPTQQRHLAFLRCWTAKEAVLKALGKGITGSLADFQVSIDKHWQGLIECGRTRCWVQRLTLGDEYIGAVTCVGRERSVRCWTFSK
jgi:4'-phosphopantetheinyl transferase